MKTNSSPAWLLLGVLVLVDCGGQTESPTGQSTPDPPASLQPSCRAPAPGTDAHCGTSGSLDCCEALPVSGGTFNRDNNPDAPATLSDFKLDRFEVTVGRFRAFVAAYPGSRPKPGDGAHPRIPGSGWRQEWDAYLPKDAAGLSQKLGHEDDPVYRQTWSGIIAWTAQPGANETMAVNGLSWPIALAFCAWDGGRLPTEAEWTYAALGGSEQRFHPWGNEPPDQTRSVSSNTILQDKKLLPVGSALLGAGRWGHLDMDGNLQEHVFDGVSHQDYYAMDCHDCTLLDPYPYPELDGRRLRDFGSATARIGIQLQQWGDLFGVRCARD
jgi:formylglycine-generating enzyme required for sulfatase activity